MGKDKPSGGHAVFGIPSIIQQHTNPGDSWQDAALGAPQLHYPYPGFGRWVGRTGL